MSVVRDHLADVDREVPGAADAKTLDRHARARSWTMAAIELGVDATESERIHHFRLTRAAAEESSARWRPSRSRSAGTTPGSNRAGSTSSSAA